MPYLFKINLKNPAKNPAVMAGVRRFGFYAITKQANELTSSQKKPSQYLYFTSQNYSCALPSSSKTKWAAKTSSIIL